MTGFSFDSNILIDALAGLPLAVAEIRHGLDHTGQVWISRMVWVEVLSKGEGVQLRRAQVFLQGFGIDEVDTDTASRAAALRRERPRLRSPDAIILASAQLHGRILITRNTKDFPPDMPGIRVPYIL